jgi:hypothetical protein
MNLFQIGTRIFFFRTTLAGLPEHAAKTFRPELSILHNMGIGSLSTLSSHQEIIFNTMEKGYIESGAALNNIFRFKYVNLFYWGFGAGAFYRYGPYSFSETIKNFAVKLSVTFSL